MANCSSQRAVSSLPPPRQRMDASPRGEEEGRENEESPREAEGWEGLSRHSPHAILHTPLSVLYSTLLHYAGTAYKRRVVPAPPPVLPTRTAICPSGYSSSSLCATAINTSPSAVARLSNEKSTLLYADRFIIRIKLRQSASFDQFEADFSHLRNSDIITNVVWY